MGKVHKAKAAARGEVQVCELCGHALQESTDPRAGKYPEGAHVEFVGDLAGEYSTGQVDAAPDCTA